MFFVVGAADGGVGREERAVPSDERRDDVCTASEEPCTRALQSLFGMHSAHRSLLPQLFAATTPAISLRRTRFLARGSSLGW